MARTHKAPGKSHRNGITLLELAAMFPDEQAAIDWFEARLWPNGRCCGHCGSVRTREVPNRKPMPYWCTDCRSYFSVKTGTALERSKVPLRKWVFAVYICVTHLKSVSSMKLHRDLAVTQRTAWFMLHRLREAWSIESGEPFTGAVEADETFVGGKAKNMHAKKRRQLTGRGGADKAVMVGMKDRKTKKVATKVVERTDAETLCGFVNERITDGTTVYTDDAPAYNGLPNHESVKHGVGEYVRGMSHINGMESFWSMFKRAYVGTFHRMSFKHLPRYIAEVEGRHNGRERDTIDQMTDWVAGLVGKRLMYRDLIADAE